MKKPEQKPFFTAVCILSVFLLWTIAIQIMDVRPIGPNNSAVGFATINHYIHELTGVHLGLYILTDWLSLIPLLFVIGFAFLGFMQWIHRKNIRKIDRSILILGGSYMAILAIYILFDQYAVNYRPILIQGILEPSYPSSTTLLTMYVMLTARIQLRFRIQNTALKNCASAFILVFTIFMVVARFVSGVHWFTDIIGGILLSAGLVTLYRFLTKSGL